MTIRLGPNQYGKAETHLVRVTKDGTTHDIKDVSVSIALGQLWQLPRSCSLTTPFS